MTDILTVTIGADPPSRLDKALARDVPADAHLSRSRLARLIAEGRVSRDGRTLTEAKAGVAEGDVLSIRLDPPEETELLAEAIPLSVVHEDDDLIVIDKPAGMVVHPAPGAPSGTLVNALLHHLGDRLSGVGGERRPGIVHRIDKDTSGLLVVAKTDRAHHALAAQFETHAVERAYVALCHGVPDRADPRLSGLPGVVWEGGTLRISARIGRHPSDRQRQAVLRDGGRHAVTRATVEERFGDAAARLTCRLETGRTHQIRVHMAWAGHPLIGDPVYGRRTAPRGLTEAAQEAVRAFPRQALHAATLGFEHPDGRRMRFDSDPPDDLAHLIDTLRAGPPQ